MIVVGAPNQWVELLDSFVPEILELVRSTWGTMPSFPSDQREDPTTEEFCRRLRKSRGIVDLPLRIDIQAVELDPAADQDQGRMDIAFSPMVPDESIYFCLECKRLNVVRNGAVRAYSSEYVTHGMLRFVTGQYAAVVRQGGMLGYVMDGDMPRAIHNVEGVIKRRHKELAMKSPGNLAQSSIRPADATAKESWHQRRNSKNRDFLLHHLFVARP
jgi:hypothetical protein